jgi:hypothetical protein
MVGVEIVLGFQVDQSYLEESIARVELIFQMLGSLFEMEDSVLCFELLVLYALS